MLLADRVPSLKGHWHLDVREGDIIRAPLTDNQLLENAFVLETARLTGELPPFLHRGRILNRRVRVIEGENLVTTNGKGLLLDRLFALGTPPTQVNTLGVGNSATAAVVGDSQLLGSAPVPYLQAFDSLPTRAGLVVTSVTTVATGNGNQNWQELGQFNGATNGTSILFNRIAPIGPFNKTSAVSIIVTVTITQS